MHELRTLFRGYAGAIAVWAYRPTVQFMVYAFARALVPASVITGPFVAVAFHKDSPVILSIPVLVFVAVVVNRVASYVVVALGKAKDVAKARVYSYGYLGVATLFLLNLVLPTRNADITKALLILILVGYLTTFVGQVAAASEPWSVPDDEDDPDTPGANTTRPAQRRRDRHIVLYKPTRNVAVIGCAYLLASVATYLALSIFLAATLGMIHTFEIGMVTMPEVWVLFVLCVAWAAATPLMDHYEIVGFARRRRVPRRERPIPFDWKRTI